MDGNANRSGEFSERYILWSEVRERAGEMTRAVFATWHLFAPHCQVQVPKMVAPAVYFLSMILLVSIYIATVAEYCGLEASHLWNCWRKPRYVAVTESVLLNSPTAAVRCYTDQCSISAKLLTTLYMLTVSTKVALTWHSGFLISKTIRCFWRTCICLHILWPDRLLTGYSMHAIQIYVFSILCKKEIFPFTNLNVNIF